MIKKNLIARRRPATFNWKFPMIGCLGIFWIMMNGFICFAGSEHSLPQKHTVTGIITDGSTGEAMVGVNIVIEGKKTGTISDISGKYSIEVTDTNAVLSFSFIGYITEKVTYTGQRILDVKLSPDITKLEDVVVVGYGSMKKVDLTGSVASLKGDQLTRVNSGSVSTSLAGRLPGLEVTQVSGAPGASAVFKIRGVGSINSFNGPLIIIDGFEGNMDQVDPSDVESLSVLKDAASSSIYGSRAANGVILITTKRGKNQPLKVEFNGQYGIQQATKIPAVLNSEEWARKMNESTQARSSIQYYTEDQAPELQTYTNNWLDYAFQPAATQNYHLSASGGSEKVMYSINLGYFDQDGTMINENFKRITLRTNLDYVADKYSFGATISQFVSSGTSSLTSESGVMIDALRTPPTIPAFKADGTFGTPRVGYPGENQLLDNTPSIDANSFDNTTKINSTMATMYLEVHLLKGLKFKTQVNATINNGYYQNFKKQWYSYMDDEHTAVWHSTPVAILREDNSNSFQWEWQNMLTYNLDVKKHHLDALLGYSSQMQKNTDAFAQKSGYSRNTLMALDAGESDPFVGGAPAQNSLISLFGRVNYSLMDRYLLQVNFRRDGSSVFAEGHRWGMFPSVSLGWRVSEEDFMKSLPFVSNLKLRLGYGTLGNSLIPSYKWLSTLAFGGYILGDKQKLVPTSQVEEAFNTDISWEKTTTENLGIDLGFLNSKINLSAEIFTRKTSNMLLLANVPLSFGVNYNPFVNIGAVENRGWEATLDYNDKKGDFSYNFSFNITQLKNKITDMGGTPTLDFGGYRDQEGESINSYYGYVVDGILQNDADTLSYHEKGYHPRAGDFRFRDLDGNDTITENDRQIIGNSIPRFYYGASASLKWRNFDLGIIVQGEAKKKILMTPSFGMDFGALYDYANMYKDVYDKRWKGPGDDSYYPALGSGVRSINNQANTRWIQNASYLRVKSIQVGYSLSHSVCKKMHVDQLRIFVTGSNLFTFSKYAGFDPEMDKVITQGGADYPQSRTTTVGLNIAF